jgi:hypothetical protein
MMKNWIHKTENEDQQKYLLPPEMSTLCKRSTRSRKARKKNKGRTDYRQRYKIVLFKTNIIIYVENPKKATFSPPRKAKKISLSVISFQGQHFKMYCISIK